MRKDLDLLTDHATRTFYNTIPITRKNAIFLNDDHNQMNDDNHNQVNSMHRHTAGQDRSVLNEPKNNIKQR
jgi:hypothetical protein